MDKLKGWQQRFLLKLQLVSMLKKANTMEPQDALNLLNQVSSHLN